jgi:hypothetical protein
MNISRRFAIGVGGLALAEIIYELTGAKGIFRTLFSSSKPKELIVLPEMPDSLKPIDQVNYNISEIVEEKFHLYYASDLEEVIAQTPNKEDKNVDQVEKQIAYITINKGSQIEGQMSITDYDAGQILLVPSSNSKAINYFISANHIFDNLKDELTPIYFRKNLEVKMGYPLIYSEESDLVLGWVYGDNLDLKPISFGDNITKDQEVHVKTSVSSENPNKSASGRILNYNDSYIVTDIKIQEKHSGSPLVAQDGTVLGIMTYGLKLTNNELLGVAIRSSYINDLINYYTNTFKQKQIKS